MDIPHDRVSKFLTFGGLAMACAAASFGYNAYADRELARLKVHDVLKPHEEKLTDLRSMPDPLALHVQDCTRTGDAILQQAQCLSGRTASAPEWNSLLQRVRDRETAIFAEQQKLNEARKRHEAEYADAGRLFALRLLMSGAGLGVGALLAGLGLSKWLKEEGAVVLQGK